MFKKLNKYFILTSVLDNRKENNNILGIPH